MSNVLACYQLLELNVISAQDLASVGRSMRTYAVAWIDPDRKLSTEVDSEGGRDPTWNDKFVFRVDEEFLYDENSTITIDIYAVHWFKDIHVGTAHVLSEDIIPPSQPSNNKNYKPSGMHFVGLQVLRPSGRPKGILNVGLAVIDGSMRSMPLYTHNDSQSVDYHQSDQENEVSHQAVPELRRSKSDTSSMMGSEIVQHEKRIKTRNGIGSSQVSPSEVSTTSKKKSSSMLSGSMFSGSKTKSRPNSKKGKSGKTKKKYSNEVNSTPKVSYDYEVESTSQPQFQNSPAYGTPKISYDYEVNSSPQPQFQNSPAYTSKGGLRATSLHALAINNAVANANMEYSTPYRSNMGNRRFMMTNSELGPSASEVAAAVAMQPAMDEDMNSTMTGWTLDQSVEDLQPKIDRWRTDLPPVYDGGEMSSIPSSKKKGKHSHRHTMDENDDDDDDDDAGKNGKFSCFSVICGVECSIVCGGDKKNDKKKNRTRRTQSVDDQSFI